MISAVFLACQTASMKPLTASRTPQGKDGCLCWSFCLLACLSACVSVHVSASLTNPSSICIFDLQFRFTFGLSYFTGQSLDCLDILSSCMCPSSSWQLCSHTRQPVDVDIQPVCCSSTRVLLFWNMSSGPTFSVTGRSSPHILLQALYLLNACLCCMSWTKVQSH